MTILDVFNKVFDTRLFIHYHDGYYSKIVLCDARKGKILSIPFMGSVLYKQAGLPRECCECIKCRTINKKYVFSHYEQKCFYCSQKDILNWNNKNTFEKRLIEMFYKFKEFVLNCNVPKNWGVHYKNRLKFFYKNKETYMQIKKCAKEYKIKPVSIKFDEIVYKLFIF